MTSFPPVDPKQSFWQLQQEILEYWKQHDTFRRSIETRSADNAYRFYDGPPFITGTPHYGSLLSSIVKDVVGRYWTMRGKRVERVWGWDCHGVPIEQKVQKSLGIETSREIEDRVGIERFIEECYRYTRDTSAEWSWYIDNIGRWVDLAGAYRTMDQDYMESVLWVFRTLWERGHIYEGKRVSLYSTALSTPISNFEVAMDNSYAEANDPAITVAFDLSVNWPEWENTYALAWTTTPWTIPANMALAINKNVEYVEVALHDEKYARNNREAWFIVAKNRVDIVFHGREYTVKEGIASEKLIWLLYTPPFDFYAGKTGNENDHRIYHGDFITDTDGTGIGHEAPEFGDYDFEQIAKPYGVTVSNALDTEGKYTAEIPDFQGIFYRDANDTIMQRLAEKWQLFKKESITHRVAFCPRSGTPLIYKAQNSWFVDIQSSKQKLLSENENIDWFPAHFKHGRFQKSVEAAPDWCVSRTRYWGTPMPVWRSADGSETIVVGSRDEIMQLTRDEGIITKIIFVRHGRTDYNEKKCYDGEGKARLTDAGQRQAEEFANAFRDTDIDAIYSSPLQRCVDTVTPLANVKNMSIQTDERLSEMSIPDIQDTPVNYRDRRWKYNPHEGGETPAEISERSMKFLREAIARHRGQTIVICTHSEPSVTMRLAIHQADYDTRKPEFSLTNNPKKSGKMYAVDYIFSDDCTLFDLHRPYIDRVKIKSPKTGNTLTRIPEVLDVWMDSGSMPYAQLHYPFENEQKMEASFPADFIAEYVGQVRAWFYLMHVVSTLLFDSPAFLHVIVTGVIYGNDGRKMSKSFQNYPDPRATIEKYGADPIRFYTLSSPLLSGGDINFSEDGIIDATKRIILPLWNAYSFFTTYANIDGWTSERGETIFVRHGETHENAEKKLNGGADDSPLNETGQTQATEAGKRLALEGKAFDLIITSPKIRARKTAESIAQETGYTGEILVESGFIEQDYGRYHGMTHEQIKAEYQQTHWHLDHWTSAYRENETEPFDDFVDRVVSAYERIQSQHPEKNILIVAHGGTLRALRYRFYGLSREEGVYGQYGYANCEIMPLPRRALGNILDTWLITKSQRMIRTVNEAFESYNIPVAARAISTFLDELTNWYIRRSRRRFWRSENDTDKQEAYETLYSTLVDLVRVMAPLTPFTSEYIYRALTGRESVHLDLIPQHNNARILTGIESAMDTTRSVVALGLALRARKKIRVRQPLRSITIAVDLDAYYLDIIREELNVKEVKFARAETIAQRIGKPNARLLGAKLGSAVQEVIRLAKAGQFTENADGTIAVGEYALAQDEFEIVYEPLDDNDNVEWDGTTVIAMDLDIDEALAREGAARDLVRAVQDLRKEAGYEVSDRIALAITDKDGHGDIGTLVAEHKDYIETETLSEIVERMSSPDKQAPIVIDAIEYTLTVAKR